MAEVRVDVALAHRPELVWQALTDPVLLGRWFLAVDAAPRPGGTFTLDPGPAAGLRGPVTCHVVEFVRPYRLVMRWQGELLYTRTTWQITPTDPGCRLLVTQAGFIGAPAAVRRPLLQATYRQAFAGRLPTLLDQLASAVHGNQRPANYRAVAAVGSEESGDAPPSGAGGAGVDAAASAAADEAGGRVDPVDAGESFRPRVPRQRWVRRNATFRSPERPAPTGQPAPAAGAARTGDPPAPSPPRTEVVVDRTGTIGQPAVDVAGGPGPGRRAVVAVTTAAVVAGAVLAALVHVTEPRPGGEAYQDAPGFPRARQPGLPDRAPAPAPSLDPALRQLAGDSPVDTSAAGGDAPADASADGDTGDRPDDRSPTGAATGEPASPWSGSDLTARLSSTGLPLLLGRSVEVVVANPGTTAAQGWELVVTVGDQDVVNVTGANVARRGTLAVFTPQEPSLPAGARHEVRFQLRAPTLGLLGAQDPSSCTINGRPCGSG